VLNLIFGYNGIQRLSGDMGGMGGGGIPANAAPQTGTSQSPGVASTSSGQDDGGQLDGNRPDGGGQLENRLTYLCRPWHNAAYRCRIEQTLVYA